MTQYHDTRPKSKTQDRVGESPNTPALGHILFKVKVLFKENSQDIEKIDDIM